MILETLEKPRTEVEIKMVSPLLAPELDHKLSRFYNQFKTFLAPERAHRGVCFSDLLGAAGSDYRIHFAHDRSYNLTGVASVIAMNYVSSSGLPLRLGFLRDLRVSPGHELQRQWKHSYSDLLLRGGFDRIFGPMDGYFTLILNENIRGQAALLSLRRQGISYQLKQKCSELQLPLSGGSNRNVVWSALDAELLQFFRENRHFDIDCDLVAETARRQREWQLPSRPFVVARGRDGQILAAALPWDSSATRSFARLGAERHRVDLTLLTFAAELSTSEQLECISALGQAAAWSPDSYVACAAEGDLRDHAVARGARIVSYDLYRVGSNTEFQNQKLFFENALR